MLALFDASQRTAVVCLDVADVQVHGARSVLLRRRCRAPLQAALRAVGVHGGVVRPQLQAALIVTLRRGQITLLECTISHRLLLLCLLLHVGGRRRAPPMDEAIHLPHEALQIRSSRVHAG